MVIQYDFTDDTEDSARFERAFAQDPQGCFHDINGITRFERRSRTLDSDRQDLVRIHPDHIEVQIASYAQELPAQDFDAARAYVDAMIVVVSLPVVGWVSETAVA